MTNPYIFSVFLSVLVLPIATTGFILPTGKITTRTRTRTTTTTNQPLSLLSSSSSHPAIELHKTINSNNIELHAFWNRSPESTELVRGEKKNENTKNRTPFIVDRVEVANKEDREQISSLIIKVFFEEEAERKQLSSSASDGGSSNNMT